MIHWTDGGTDGHQATEKFKVMSPKSEELRDKLSDDDYLLVGTLDTDFSGVEELEQRCEKRDKF